MKGPPVDTLSIPIMEANSGIRFWFAYLARAKLLGSMKLDIRKNLYRRFFKEEFQSLANLGKEERSFDT